MVEKLSLNECACSLQLTTLASRDKPPSQGMCLVDLGHSPRSYQGHHLDPEWEGLMRSNFRGPRDSSQSLGPDPGLTWMSPVRFTAHPNGQLCVTEIVSGLCQTQ